MTIRKRIHIDLLLVSRLVYCSELFRFENFLFKLFTHILNKNLMIMKNV